MSYLLTSLAAAGSLLASFDAELYFIILTSLEVSVTAAFLAAGAGVPLGIWIALNRFRGREGVLLLLNTLMAIPTVVVGLFLYGLIGRSGPLGGLGLLFTTTGIVIGEVILAWPIMTNLTLSAVEGMDPRLQLTCKTLGATPVQQAVMVLKEARYGVMAAVVAGFGRVIGEVGIAMMLGGNIRGFTRTITTAIALETSKGEFELGLALGIVLLAVALAVNTALFLLQRKRPRKPTP